MKLTSALSPARSSHGILRSAAAAGAAVLFSASLASAADTYVWTGANNSILNAGANYQGNPLVRLGNNTSIPNGGPFNTIVFSGTLTGNGSTTALVTGDFHIGTIQFTAATGTGPITLSPSGTAAIQRLSVYTSIIVDAGAGENTFAADLGLGDRSVTFTNNSSNAFLISGNILGGTGLGTLNLTSGTIRVQGGAKSYDGEIKVQNAATLLLSAASFTSPTSRVTVEAGGKLAGTGSIGGSAGTVNIESGGSLQAGGVSPGSLSIGGNLSLESGAVTLLSLASETSYSQLSVAGALNYGGELRLTITSDLLADAAPGSVFNLITGFASHTGTLDSITFYDPINGQIGQLTSLSGGLWSGTIEGVQFSFNEASGSLSVVPEPGQASLLLIGGALAVAFGSRKRRDRAVLH